MKEYGDDNDEEDEDDSAHMSDSDSEEDVPDLITSRPDFPDMVNTFLDKYELVGGRKLKQKLEGGTGIEKLENLRKAMGVDSRVKVDGSSDESGEDDWKEEENAKDRWDCETILSQFCLRLSETASHDFQQLTPTLKTIRV